MLKSNLPRKAVLLRRSRSTRPKTPHAMLLRLMREPPVKPTDHELGTEGALAALTWPQP
jgi:hypothetical protein